MNPERSLRDGIYEQQIELRWRDFDAFGHVNNAVYLNFIEEARDEWLELAVGKGSSWDFVLVRVAIDFRRELRVEADQFVTVSCRLDRIGRSSVHTREEVRTEAGECSAEAQSVLVARDRGEARSRPLSDEEQRMLGSLLGNPGS